MLNIVFAVRFPCSLKSILSSLGGLSSPGYNERAIVTAPFATISLFRRASKTRIGHAHELLRRFLCPCLGLGVRHERNASGCDCIAGPGSRAWHPAPRCEAGQRKRSAAITICRARADLPEAGPRQISPDQMDHHDRDARHLLWLAVAPVEPWAEPPRSGSASRFRPSASLLLRP